MTDASVWELLRDLTAKTERGGREWEEAPRERDTFFTALDAGTVVVRRKPIHLRDEYGDAVRCEQILVQMQTAAGEVVLERSFVGPDGYVADEEATAEFCLAHRLWNAARETARNADELLEAILREVRGELQAAA